MSDLPVYWINMTKRADRRRHMLQHFDQLHITDHTRITPIVDVKPNASCINSHHTAMKTAYLDRHDMVMIVEDDLVLTTRCLNRVDQALKLLPEGWDCLQVHTIDPSLIEAVLDKQYPNAIVEGYLMACTCYIFNRNGLKKMLDKMGHTEARYTLLDNAISEQFVYNYCNSYFMLHPIVNTNETRSDIQSSDDLNIKNMNVVNRFLQADVDCNWFPGVLHMPPGVHWSGNTAGAEQILKTMFGSNA